MKLDIKPEFKTLTQTCNNGYMQLGVKCRSFMILSASGIITVKYSSGADAQIPVGLAVNTVDDSESMELLSLHSSIAADVVTILYGDGKLSSIPGGSGGGSGSVAVDGLDFFSGVETPIGARNTETEVGQPNIEGLATVPANVHAELAQVKTQGADQTQVGVAGMLVREPWESQSQVTGLVSPDYIGLYTATYGDNKFLQAWSTSQYHDLSVRGGYLLMGLAAIQIEIPDDVTSFSTRFQVGGAVVGDGTQVGEWQDMPVYDVDGYLVSEHGYIDLPNVQAQGHFNGFYRATFYVPIGAGQQFGFVSGVIAGGASNIYNVGYTYAPNGQGAPKTFFPFPNPTSFRVDGAITNGVIVAAVTGRAPWVMGVQGGGNAGGILSLQNAAQTTKFWSGFIAANGNTNAGPSDIPITKLPGNSGLAYVFSAAQASGAVSVQYGFVNV